MNWNNNYLIVSFSIFGVIILLLFGYRLLLRSYGKGKQAIFQPHLYSLEGNFFKGQVRFFFELPHEEIIKFYLRNSSDNVEYVIADGLCESGGHPYNFDTNNLVDGEYFYILETANKVIEKKMNIKNNRN